MIQHRFARIRCIAVAWLAALLVAVGPEDRAANAGPMLLFDPATGAVLFAESADQPWYPASLTKLMTTYLAFEALKKGAITWETKLVTSEHAHQQPPSKIGLPVGGELGLEIGLRAVVIKSANDVSVMLAEAIGGTEEEFVKKMNAKASELGMRRTHFANANGLPDPRQMTTARDMGLLARALLRDFPEHAAIFAEQRMQLGKIRLRSHNTLLRTFEGADGMKTGFICASGYNVVASATRDGRKLIAVVLGETSGKARADRAAALLEHGFEHYQWKALFDPPRIDAMPYSASAEGGPQDIRSVVTAFECGHRVAKRRTRKAREAARAERKAKLASKKNGARVPTPAAKAESSAATQASQSAPSVPATTGSSR